MVTYPQVSTWLLGTKSVIDLGLHNTASQVTKQDCELLWKACESASCQTGYLDGSFVSSKLEPGDFDACWDEKGVDLDKLDPVLLNI